MQPFFGIIAASQEGVLNRSHLVTASNNLITTGFSMSDKRILPAFLLCFFFGVFGIHRFYVGKVGTGILQLLTLGGFGIWAFIDFIMIIVGAFSDKEGHVGIKVEV